MAVCDTCGNDYDKAFTLTYFGEVRTFDSFECAIHLMAPTCSQCEVRILGHGVETEEAIFCCAHCARRAGHDTAQDNVTA